MKYYIVLVMIINLVSAKCLQDTSNEDPKHRNPRDIYYESTCSCCDYGEYDDILSVGDSIFSQLNSLYDNMKGFLKPYYIKVKGYFFKPKNLYKGTESEDPCVKKYDNCKRISEYTEASNKDDLYNMRQRKLRCIIGKDGNIHTVDVICNQTTGVKRTELNNSIGLDPINKNNFESTSLSTAANEGETINFDLRLGIDITKPQKNITHNVLPEPDKDRINQNEINPNVEDNSNKTPISFDAVQSKESLPKEPPVDHGSTQAGLDNETPDGYRDISLEAVEDKHVIPSPPPVEHGSKQAGLNNVNKNNRL